MATTNDYKKLPGSTKFMITGLADCSLWRGEDHLLYVKRTMMSEEYSRFYYSDICSLVSVKTHTGKVINAISLGIFSLLFLIVFMAMEGGIAGKFLWGLGVGSPALVVLFVNLWKGPTCNTYLHTSVQEKKIKSLGRIKYVNGAMEEIDPLIESRQEPMPREILEEKYQRKVSDDVFFTSSTEGVLRDLDEDENKRPKDELSEDSEEEWM